MCGFLPCGHLEDMSSAKESSMSSVRSEWFRSGKRRAFKPISTLDGKKADVTAMAESKERPVIDPGIRLKTVPWTTNSLCNIKNLATWQTPRRVTNRRSTAGGPFDQYPNTVLPQLRVHAHHQGFKVDRVSHGIASRVSEHVRGI
ncbi:hypothetical protein C8R44DRAFT_753834 [Mycena epipterygia]|nr:hypothetical protein C8R44DRAFT_753834 [Mycena epipterygia]